MRKPWLILGAPILAGLLVLGAACDDDEEDDGDTEEPAATEVMDETPADGGEETPMEGEETPMEGEETPMEDGEAAE